MPEEVIHLRVDNEPYPLSNGDIKDYIHEARTSVMITGLDDWFWTAYCFVDAKFKGSEHKESIDSYANPEGPHRPLNARTPARDPLSCGKREVNLPTWNPRQYFLQILSIRMEQVKQEWENSVFLLLRHIKPCVCNRYQNQHEV